MDSPFGTISNLFLRRAFHFLEKAKDETATGIRRGPSIVHFPRGNVLECILASRRSNRTKTCLRASAFDAFVDATLSQNLPNVQCGTLRKIIRRYLCSAFACRSIVDTVVESTAGRSDGGTFSTRSSQ